MVTWKEETQIDDNNDVHTVTTWYNLQPVGKTTLEAGVVTITATREIDDSLVYREIYGQVYINCDDLIYEKIFSSVEEAKIGVISFLIEMKDDLHQMLDWHF